MYKKKKRGKGLKLSGGAGRRYTHGKPKGEGLKLSGQGHEMSGAGLELSGSGREKLLKEIQAEYEGQGGGGKRKFWKGVKKISKKGLRLAMKFVAGKTKFKPSDLAALVKTGFDIASVASIVDPRLKAIAPVLKVGSTVAGVAQKELKKSGRGGAVLYGSGDYSGEGILPKRFQKWIHKNTREAKKVIAFVKKHKKAIIAGTMAVAGLGGAVAVALAKHLASKPASVKHAVDIASAVSSVAGIPPPQPLKREKRKPVKDKPVPTGVHGVVDTPGEGALDRKKMPYGVTMMGNGRVKKDRYSVFYGYHKKTSSGLTKSDFMKKGKKIISKKRHQRGKAMYASGSGIYA